MTRKYASAPPPPRSISAVKRSSRARTLLPSTRAARPYSDRDFQLVIDTLGDAAARRVLHDNAAGFYHAAADREQP